MKILMLLGSPHKKGTTAALAESFVKGAKENNHEVVCINCNGLTVHPCIACTNCISHGVCVWTDDMVKIEAEATKADLIVFVTPIYYIGMTAQLKLVLDRFFSFDKVIMENKPRLALLTAATNPDEMICEPTVKQIDILAKYYGTEFVGMVNAVGCKDAEALAGTDFVQKAYELAKSL
ncbi:MAG: flavodoxin family protein [archaeon]|nr:flavodoxin family protein [archaeon]